MASQTSSASETSGTNATAGSNQLHHMIQVDPVRLEPSQHFVEMLLDRDWKNEEFSKLLVEYFDDSQKTINYAAAVKKDLYSHQSFIQDANWEAPLKICHGQFFDDLDGVHMQHVVMQDKLQSFQDDLSQKLHRAQFWTKFFSAVVVLTTAAATVSARKQPISAVMALASFLLGTLCGWRVSHLDNRMDGVKKHVEITGFMGLGARITVDRLRSLRSSARRYETQTKSMAESDAGEERKKLVERFQELQGNAALFCRDICSARECTLQSLKKHLDSISEIRT